jgi:hypothetical protein
VSTLWAYLWPAFSAGALIGVIAGLIGFRRRARRNAALGIGVGLSLACALLWSGPLGGADRLVRQIERRVHYTLVYYEMTQVSAKLHHHPLTRRILLSGPADDFQRSELVRVMEEIPGVSKATWSPRGSAGVPLIAEGLGAALLGFLLGALLAYALELRRRYNAQWNW